ncbi:MAG: short-chain dehydrogenase/reductase [Bacteroidetes bacterium]|uniref:SDR family NAD(P)-dependent oxidoreductase n=1 Tax=unclassified Chitinophaga TaxID=2619133 RepID=UPI0009CEB0B7|nr:MULTISPECIES: SDR family oxidoreductase [unclassified Chitinophaga]MBP1652174.1 short-chain dehydrogenase/reductase [Bacteroidota bacterium]OMP75825.1 short-chain dehydrogenase [[Flexibacter] sp. ATCC 35208]WPV66113.1 SDR family oxidoreductase [Chitinophaga sp. LS1]
MQLLTGKIILLTGGSTGIGFECALKYAEAGAVVVVVSNDATTLTTAINTLGDNHYSIYADISQTTDVQQMIALILEKYGRIDVIHNNAAIAHPSKPLHETAETEWDDLMNINLKSIFLTTRYGIEALKSSKGCIINTSSLVGEIGQENHAAYTATKGAVNALTKSMALDYAPYQIRVNAVAPAGVWTPMLREWGKYQNNGQGIDAYMNAIHPLGYCPEGDVIADACVFLASDKARFITGHIMHVSGGAELGYRALKYQD